VPNFRGWLEWLGSGFQVWFGLVDGVGFGCLEPPVSPAGNLLLPGVLLSFQQGGLTTKHTLNIVFGLTIKIAVNR